MQRLNRFYSLASNTIFDYDGTLDKLVGDQVMAFFGAPLHAEDHPKRAVQVALRIISGMNSLVGGEPLHVGAGIATGEAFVGNVGEGAVTDYTVLGDTVNVAARLQGSRLQERSSSPKKLIVMSIRNFPKPPLASWNSKARANWSALE
jgi:adenylate cyclase